jgi:hypothetical protein
MREVCDKKNKAGNATDESRVQVPHLTTATGRKTFRT